METFSPLPQSHFCNIDPFLKAGYQVWNIGEFRWKRYFSSKIRILKVLCQGWPVSNLLPSAPGPCNSFTLFKTQKKKEKKNKNQSLPKQGLQCSFTIPVLGQRDGKASPGFWMTYAWNKGILVSLGHAKYCLSPIKKSDSAGTSSGWLVFECIDVTGISRTQYKAKLVELGPQSTRDAWDASAFIKPLLP